MKKSEELSRKTRKMIAKNLIVLAALAVVAFVGAFSWFTSHTKAVADGISIETVTNHHLEYYVVEPKSYDQYVEINQLLARNAVSNTENSGQTGYVTLNEEWHNGAITFDPNEQEFRFMENLFMNEVTSDGVSFKKADLLQYGDYAIVDEDEPFDDAVANRDYLSFDIYFRSDEEFQLYLKGSTTLAPVGTIDNTEEGMKNAAIGAVRMSIINNNTRQLLWIPAPCIFYDSLGQFYPSGSTDLGTKQVLTGLSPSEFGGKGNVYRDNSTDPPTYAYRDDGTNVHVYYEDDGTSRTLSSIDSQTTGFVASTSGNYRLGSDKPLVVLNHTGYTDQNQETADGYYYGYVRVNIWIEGEDSEARLDMVGGMFNLSLNVDVNDN